MEDTTLIKQKTIQAIQELIVGYESNTLIHTNSKYPLCKLYYYHGCKNCPNVAFNYLDTLSCEKYPNLNYFYFINNENLANFWRAVENYIDELNDDDYVEMGDMVRQDILNIAEKFNHD